MNVVPTADQFHRGPAWLRVSHTRPCSLRARRPCCSCPTCCTLNATDEAPVDLRGASADQPLSLAHRRHRRRRSCSAAPRTRPNYLTDIRTIAQQEPEQLG